MLRTLGIVVLMLWFLPTFAKDNSLYRWQDAHGKWHFGDAPEMATKPNVQLVQNSPETANFIKTKIVKLPPTKVEKSRRSSSRKSTKKRVSE